MYTYATYSYREPVRSSWSVNRIFRSVPQLELTPVYNIFVRATLNTKSCLKQNLSTFLIPCPRIETISCDNKDLKKYIKYIYNERNCKIKTNEETVARGVEMEKNSKKR